MRKLVLTVLLALMPTSVAAQEFGVAGKLGSLGVGIDGAYAVNSFLSVRGGVGVIPGGSLLNDLLPSEIDDIPTEFELPSPSFTLGVDLKIAGPFRVMGGLLFQSDNLEATGALIEPTDIGNGVYGPGGTLSLTLDQNSVIPYLGIGFGSVPASGFGVFLDLALGFGAGGEVFLDASDDLRAIPGFDEDLELEVVNVNDEVGSLGSLYPVVQFGVRYGLGR